MRRYIVAGNWKMNGTREGVKELLLGVQDRAEELTDVDWIVFPPSVFLEETERLLTGSNVAWGTQNVSDKPVGAFTGEISVSMLKEFGCKYVLVGHSERRNLYSEDDVIVAAKFVEASDAGLIPILCVGETLREREQDRTFEVVSRQIGAVLRLDNGVERLANAIVAYEPVWAIGTGITATPEQAQEVHQAIRSQISNYGANIAQNLQILYGGSVKPGNALAIFAMPDIDGGLIGGAALKAGDFIEIGKSCIS